MVHIGCKISVELFLDDTLFHYVYTVHSIMKLFVLHFCNKNHTFTTHNSLIFLKYRRITLKITSSTNYHKVESQRAIKITQPIVSAYNYIGNKVDSLKTKLNYPIVVKLGKHVPCVTFSRKAAPRELSEKKKL